MIDYFAGVILWTDNLETMASFYRDTLGLPVHSAHPAFVAFQLGAVRLSVGLHSEVRGPAREAGRIMVNLGVGNIRRAHARLREAGVEFLRVPEQEHWGGWVATFRDPDGNIVQLLQVVAEPAGADPG